MHLHRSGGNTQRHLLGAVNVLCPNWKVLLGITFYFPCDLDLPLIL
jgi:hypothetical protein